jgi:choline dehydrogenase-like flavoprotein
MCHSHISVRSGILSSRKPVWDSIPRGIVVSGEGRTFDVIVVGSGASGGWAAKRLAEAGVKVGLLDAGRALTDADYKEHVPAFGLRYRDQAPEVIRRTRPVQKDCYACMEWNLDWFRNDLEEPYTVAKGTGFSWQGRMQVVGGRTNVWGLHMKWGENERTIALDMMESAAEALDAAGGRNIRPFLERDRAPGWGIHELGTARMGQDGKKSVLNTRVSRRALSSRGRRAGGKECRRSASP